MSTMLAVMTMSVLAAPQLAAAVSVLPATDAKVNWAGRTAPDVDVPGAVVFDWLGVSARVAVEGATYVRVNVTATSPSGRGTRLRA